MKKPNGLPVTYGKGPNRDKQLAYNQGYRAIEKHYKAKLEMIEKNISSIIEQSQCGEEDTLWFDDTTTLLDKIRSEFTE